MPLPPPPPPPFVWGAAATAAKIACKEYLPALSSASLATWVLQWLWQRVPNWIKEDVVWENINNKKENNQERLSTLWERHRALVQVVAESLFLEPVPYWPAALWTYVHQSSHQVRYLQPACRRKRNAVYAQAGPRVKKENNKDFTTLQQALEWAVAAYTLVDEQQKLLQQQEEQQKRTKASSSSSSSSPSCLPPSPPTGLTEILQCVPSDRPGSVGYYIGLSETTSDNDRGGLLVIAIKGTSSLEDICTDTAGRAVRLADYIPASTIPHDEPAWPHDSSIEVRARVDDEIVVATATTTATEFASSVSYSVNEIAHEEKDDDCRVTSTASTQDNIAVEVISGHERVLYGGGDTTVHLPDDASRHVRCHEGILLSALTVVQQVQHLVEQYVIHGRRRLCLVGHSLGASAATLVALLLRARLPSLMGVSTNTNQRFDNDDSRDADAASLLLHVYAFGPPPVLDYDTAIACTPFVTTVVNNADLIPRCSLVNCAVGLEILRSISNRLAEGGLVPAVSPFQWTRLLQHIFRQPAMQSCDRDGVDVDPDGGEAAEMMQAGDNDGGVPMLTMDQIWQTVNEARERFPLRHPEHLYIPGKVLLFYQEWEETGAPLCEEISSSSSSSSSSTSSSSGERTTTTAMTTDPAHGSYICRETDGLALALQTFEVDGFRCLGDHTTAAYAACLQAVEDS